MAQMSIDSDESSVDEQQKTTASAASSSTSSDSGADADDGSAHPGKSSDTEAAAELPLSGLEAVEVFWERIQLVVRVRPVPGHAVLATEAEVALLPPEGEAHPLMAREARGDPGAPGERLVQFRVFVADDQMPLDAGRWRLAARWAGSASSDGEGWRAVTAHPDRLQTSTILQEFISGNFMYRVKLAEIDGARPLVVGITTWRRTDRRRSLLAWAPVRSWWRAVRHRAWIRLFHLLVGTLHRLPRRGRVLLFTSDSRGDLGGNLKLVYDRLRQRGLDRELQLKTIFKPSIRMKRTLRDRARLVWLLARAEVILLEDYQPAIHRLPQRPEQRIIQLWHAWGAFKTVGYSRMGKPGGPNPYSRVHKNYTFATVSSTHEVPFYAEAFGIPEERVIPTGTPRMDEFLDRDLQRAGRERAYEAVPSARGREVVLFAPTFRGAGARRATYPVQLIDVVSAHALMQERDAVLVVKMHPFVRRRLEIPEPLLDRVIDASDLDVATNDLLLIADVLVTDYSSLVFEYATLGRPMLFFAYDLEHYVASRDFYEPYESFVPGRIVRTFEELLDAIRREDWQHEKVAPFARRHLPDRPGSATDRIIDELILGGR
jgi:CDP-glycerol glycerophosphotransferase (TagB/SpsB family)